MMRNFIIDNKFKTATGADEAIVETMKKLIEMAEHSVITRICLQVEAVPPDAIVVPDDAPPAFKNEYLGKPYHPQSTSYIQLIRDLYRGKVIELAKDAATFKKGNRRHEHYDGFIDSETDTAWINAFRLESLLRDHGSFDRSAFNDEMEEHDAIVRQEEYTPVCKHPDVPIPFIVFYLHILKAE